MKSTLTAICCIISQLSFAQPDKHRLIVLADMGNEPDEVQQMVHLMMYNNEFDLEGLIAVSGASLHANHWMGEERRRLHPELFHDIIDAYEAELPDLRKHAKGWHDPEYLRSIVASGTPEYGIAGTGPGKSTEGSELLIEAVTKSDPRPVYVVVNAGSNTLAQAIIDYEAGHSEEELTSFISKLRVYENGAQDNAGAWICANYPGIHWMRSNYQTYCYGGPSYKSKAGRKDMDKNLGPYTWEPYAYSSIGQHQWALEHIKGDHGMLAKTWPLRQMHDGRIGYLEGGGTIPWMMLIHRGLSDIDKPHWGGWSGRFTRGKVKNEWSRSRRIKEEEMKYDDFWLYTEASDEWYNPEEDSLMSNIYTPVWRWRRAMYNDFVCRMDWCIESFENANHNPVAAVNGNSDERIHDLHATPGERIELDASASSDPDGDPLEYRWWIYREAGTWEEEPQIDNPHSPLASLTVPARSSGHTIHVILEVKDIHEIADLYDYRRIVVKID